MTVSCLRRLTKSWIYITASLTRNSSPRLPLAITTTRSRSKMEEERRSLYSSSSALMALASLTPPSPVLSPTLPVTLTSGDIPILLDLVYQVASSSLYEDDPRPGSGLNSVGPSNSNCTAGTFGPIQTRYRDSWISVSTPGNRGTFGGVTGSLIADPALDSHSLAWIPEVGCSITDDHSQVRLSASLLSSTVHTLGMVEGFTTPNPGGDDRNGEPAVFIEDEAPPLGHYIPVHTPDMAQILLPPSHSDLHYLPSNPLAHRSRLKADSSSSCPSSPRSSKDSSKGIYYGDSSDAFGISHTRHATVESLPESFQSPKGSRAYDNTTPSHDPRRSHPRLPTSLAWLDRSFIELWIDQEGFRAVQARFRFIGYSSRHTWVEHGNSPDNVALFRPISRQIFNFHYSPLEPLPVLRRITVNGDEARDYITRQASLGLKVNGVYTVQGNEGTSLPATFGDSDTPVKLCWKFEYFVDDRKVDTTGKKTVDGEKSLTPLTFSCSPLVLHPFQGKRITMIHMVKKSVATKLVAERMEPPCPHVPSPAPKPYSQQIPAHLITKSSVWNMHARAKSHALSQTEEYDGQQKPTINLNYHESPVDRVLRDARSIRRRRASSAGEMDRPSIVVASSNPGSFSVRHPARHIISRSRLADLLDQETENIPIAIASPPPLMKFSDFQPLKPSPRHHARKF